MLGHKNLCVFFHGFFSSFFTQCEVSVEFHPFACGYPVVFYLYFLRYFFLSPAHPCFGDSNEHIYQVITSCLRVHRSNFFQYVLSFCFILDGVLLLDLHFRHGVELQKFSCLCSLVSLLNLFCVLASDHIEYSYSKMSIY